MCGRYRISKRKQLIAESFDVSWDELTEWNPRYNIAPTQPVPVIRQHPKEPRRDLSMMRWGLIPSWSKDLSGGAKLINARAETASKLPAFRDPMKFRRCLIPADGFYEWKKSADTKQPFCFGVREGELFALAGLWDGWKDPSGQWIRSCSILTTTPNTVTSVVHDRMPVILSKDDYDLWLDPGMNDTEGLSDLLKPFDAGLMRSYPVSERVNQVQNDDEECGQPIVLETPLQERLFS
jgi:putative SOS response-associated peptidase YedK